MNKAVIQGLLGRKVRTILTGFAIVLGVAMVSGTFVLTDTITKAFDSIFVGSYRNTGAVISGKELVKGAASGNATVPQSLLAKVRALPGASAAAGQLFDVRGNGDLVRLIGRNDKELGSSEAPHFGWGIDTSQPRFNPLKLAAGHWAASPYDVVIDASTFKKQHYKVGDQIKVAGAGASQRFRISGMARFGSVDSLGGATFAVFQVPVAQRLLGKEARLDSISVAPKPGTSDKQLADQIGSLLPANAQVRTGTEQAKSDASSTNGGIAVFQDILLAFGLIALLVGAFVIFNTLSMNLSQRVRELATLRTLGASRKQVRRSVLLEGLVTGFVASVIGLFAGLGLAQGLDALFRALGLALPKQGVVFAPRTIVVSLLLGTGVTLLATLSPARRATNVPPISAVREGVTLPPSRLERNSGRTGLTAFLVSGLLLSLGLFANLATAPLALCLVLGCLGLFVAVGLSAVRVVAPLVSVIGIPAEWVGGAMGRLARENATRNPRQTARTAGALMIGLALITVVATLGAGLKATDRVALGRQITSDYVLGPTNFDSYPAAAGAAIAKAPGVVAASEVRSDKAHLRGQDVDVSGLDPRTAARVYRFRWTDGSAASLRSLAAGGAIVKQSYADAQHLHVGSSLSLTTSQGQSRSLRVAGIYKPPADGLDAVFGPVAIGTASFDAAFPRPKDLYTFVATRDGVTPARTAALQNAVKGYPNLKVSSRSDWINQRAAGLDQLLDIFYVLLALSVIVSLFGMVNALALSVFERTREIGMLRAVGMTRRQSRRMVRHESVITAVIGAALGLPLGVAIAAITVRAMRGEDVAFSLPIAGLITFLVIAVAAGVLAAALPARRAGRLNVLTALQYE